MSGDAGIKSINMADSEAGPVLKPGGNKAQRLIDAKKPVSKPLKKADKSKEEVVAVEDKNSVLFPNIQAKSSPLSHSVRVPSILRRHQSSCSNLSLNASCSSDASTDSFHSRASTGRMCRTSSKYSWKKQVASKARNGGVQNGVPESLPEGDQAKRRCSWAAASTDPSYIAFHDEEWGVPTHDDKEVFADFDPNAVAKLSEKKITAPGSLASSLLSELKLRLIIENARQVSKVIDEFGSFDKYIWSFVNHRPIVSSFRYPRQVPVKTPKADLISKDLVRRGFRGVGPTVVYSFMQVAGITNDHLTSCFRFHDCSTAEVEGNAMKNKLDEKKASSEIESEICRSIDELV